MSVEIVSDKSKYEKERQENIDQFNGDLKNILALFKDLPSKYKAKLHVDALYKRILTGISAQPEYAINIIGPSLIKYGERISKDEYMYFVEKDYDAILLEMSKFHKFNYDNAIKTVQFMKDAFASAESEKQKKIINTVKSMLKTYAQFSLKFKVK